MESDNYEDIYVTEIESFYPGETQFNSVVIRLYGRTHDEEARQVIVTDFKPYFLTTPKAADEINPASHQDLLGYRKTNTTPLSERFDDDPQKLVEVVTKYPHSVPTLRKKYEKTWAADTLYTERFRIDHDIETGIRVPTHKGGEGHHIVSADEIEPVEMTDVTPRVVTLDIEVDDRDSGFPDPGEARVLSIAVHDNYTDEYEVFLDLHGQSAPEFFDLSETKRRAFQDNELGLADLGIDQPDKVHLADTERAMFNLFGYYIRDKNPDVLAGWNSGDPSSDGFDLPFIISRMKKVSANAMRLSRENSVSVDKSGDDYFPEISGRAMYDLMDGWTDTKFTGVRSKKLEHAAQKETNFDGKIEHELGYYELYDQKPRKFVNYNVKDVRLTVAVNRDANIIGFKQRLKDMVGVDWSRTHENNEFIEMAIRRKCSEHGLSMITAYDNPHVGDDTDDVNYEGAYVFPAFKGVRENVLGIDLESLYPRTQQMLNVSPDTRIEKSKAVSEGIPFVEGENGQTFRDDVDGIMRELITDYMKLKAEFKEERNRAEPGTEERARAAERYSVTKTIVNSFYGYGGWNRSPLYNPHDAAAVTLTGQAVIRATAEYVNNETPGEVVYGDTDSVYCQWPNKWGQVETLEYVDYVCDHLNGELYPNLCEEYRIEPEKNRWKMELEKLCTMFMSGRKKKYATNVRWTEGMEFNEVIVQ